MRVTDVRPLILEIPLERPLTTSIHDIRSVCAIAVTIDTDEGIAGEVETIHEALYAAIQDYAANVIGTPIEYNAHAYPYWFTADGERYGNWTPRLLQAAYNYQYGAKDPGAFAHNGKYIVQVLYDSLADVGGDTSGMTRPEPVSE